jgi:MoaA/NifB/PqqE/SkfB family radical SAM enzyme
MCFYLEEIDDPHRDEIALPQMERLSISLGRMVQLSLTGGEPFLRQDIPDVVGIFARNNRVRFVTIPTNGSIPDRVTSTVEHLVAGYPEVNFRIVVSLDGYPQDHDRMRAAGSFSKIEATLGQLARIRRRTDNLIVDVNTCYSKLNEGKLNGFVDFVAERFDVDNHTVTYVRGNADERTKGPALSGYVRIVEDIRLRRNARESRRFSSLLRAVADYQRDIIKRTIMRDRMYVPCVAGKKLIVVNERGEVRPCEILDQRMGSLKDHDYDVRKVLNTNQAVELVDWIRRTKCHCTFECALATSIIFHKASYPHLLWQAFKIRLGRHQRAPQARLIGQSASPATCRWPRKARRWWWSPAARKRSPGPRPAYER